MIKKVLFSLQIATVITCFVLISSFFTFLALPRSTYGASDNSTLNVTIESVFEITVRPTYLEWALGPCREGGTKLLDIRNTGSENVSAIYAYVSTLDNETSRPYGTDDPSNYAGTSLIVIRNETDSPMYFAGRLEWNWTEDVSNKVMTNMGSACTGSAGNCSWGFVRNTSYEYMWAFSNGTDGLCNDTTNGALGLESDIDNGTAASRMPTTDGITGSGEDSDYSYWYVSRSGHLLENSCVAVSADCQKIYVYKYDQRTSPDFATCGYATPVHKTNLVPYDVHTLTLDVYSPCGIPKGELKMGNIFIVASDASV